MAHLEQVTAWPPNPIRTERLVLREPEAEDRDAIIELFTSPEVNTYVGGPRAREEMERAVPETPQRRAGLRCRARRSDDRHRHPRPARSRATWAHPSGRWGGRTRLHVPVACVGTRLRHRGMRSSTRLVHRRPSGEPVSLSTQTANDHAVRVADKLGFTECSDSMSSAPSSGLAYGPRPCHEVSSTSRTTLTNGLSTRPMWTDSSPDFKSSYTCDWLMLQPLGFGRAALSGMALLHGGVVLTGT